MSTINRIYIRVTHNGSKTYCIVVLVIWALRDVKYPLEGAAV